LLAYPSGEEGELLLAHVDLPPAFAAAREVGGRRQRPLAFTEGEM